MSTPLRLRRWLQGPAVLLAAASLAPLLGVPAAAQSVSVLNHRVRVTTVDAALREMRYVGVATTLTGDTLRLIGSGVVQAIPVPGIRQLEVSAGRRSYAFTGALVGAGLGAAAALTAVSEVDGQGSTGIAVLTVPLGIALYGGLGALVGGLFRSERWETVPLESLRQR